MTSPSIRITAQTLLARLSTSLGASPATKQEFKWMRDHAQGDLQALQGMVHRRIYGEPLQYILGTQPFGPLELKVRRPVLIPRPETEDWTLRLARLLPASSSSSPSAVTNSSNSRIRRSTQEKDEPLKLLDLCTGTGCIPLLLCHMWSSRKHGKIRVRALGVDIADEAIGLANENAEHVDLLRSQSPSSSQLNNTQDEDDSNTNARVSVSFLQADMLDDNFPRTLKELGWTQVDVLTSNPPYIPLHEYKLLSSSVRDFEDPRALLGDPSFSLSSPPELETSSKDGCSNHRRGLTFYRKIADLIRGHDLVKPGGLIALEVGHDQSAEVRHIMQSHALVRDAEVWDDPWGVPRTVVCTK